MIQLKVTSIATDADVAKVTEQLENISALNEIMVTLVPESAATIILTGSASDEELHAAIAKAGDYSIIGIQRQGIDPYNLDR